MLLANSTLLFCVWRSGTSLLAFPLPCYQARDAPCIHFLPPVKSAEKVWPNLCMTSTAHTHIHTYTSTKMVNRSKSELIKQTTSYLFFFLSIGYFSSKGEDRLFRRLFRRYNQFIRPVENVSDPVTVEFEVSISQLVKVVRITVNKYLFLNKEIS